MPPISSDHGASGDDGPTWYDVLGVGRDADSAQIKAAWRSATDRFDPGSGSRQFTMFNEAAEVLLDPDRRAAYDISLEARDAGAASVDTAPPVPAPTAGGEPDRTVEARARTRPRWAAALAGREARRPGRGSEALRGTGGIEPVVAPSAAASGRLVLVLAVLAALTVAALVLAGYFAMQVREDARVAESRRTAATAAERAAEAILAYDYRQLPQDRERAERYLTGSYRKDYLKTFTLLEEQQDGSPGAAVQSKTVVEAQALRSGIVDAAEGKARVLVFVNQTSAKEGADPQIFQNRVTLTMEKSGEKWLVDDLKSY